MKTQTHFYVYGYTDRFCGNGFPASNKAFETKEAAEKHLARIKEKGFRFCNDKGEYGWVEELPTG